MAVKPTEGWHVHDVDAAEKEIVAAVNGAKCDRTFYRFGLEVYANGRAVTVFQPEWVAKGIEQIRVVPEDAIKYLLTGEKPKS